MGFCSTKGVLGANLGYLESKGLLEANLGYLESTWSSGTKPVLVIVHSFIRFVYFWTSEFAKQGKHALYAGQ